jgi:hypothetical protein
MDGYYERTTFCISGSRQVQRITSSLGFSIVEEFIDEDENYYFSAVKVDK